ncbi:MAG TPA: hypothetical protein VFY78_02545, partial [Gammaproteobacteria bacterium]|nr:hypothetical protein [Gammaproteobacteria bacterium]
MKNHDSQPKLSRKEGRDLFQPKPVDLLDIEMTAFSAQQRLFRELLERFPDLLYYDADVSLPLRHAAFYKSFPLCSCEFTYYESGLIQDFKVLDTPWILDPVLPELSLMTLEPDCDPLHAAPQALLVAAGGVQYRLSLHTPRAFLINLQAVLKRHDPDVLLTRWGDTWLLPYLFDLADKQSVSLALNREPGHGYLQRPERSYFSY